MSKTKEELNALKEEAETMNNRFAELTEEELEQVTGGAYVKDGYGSVTFGPYIEDHYDPNTDGTY